MCKESYVVGDCEEAMAFMRHGRNYADVPRPYLILVDLKLPYANQANERGKKK